MKNPKEEVKSSEEWQKQFPNTKVLDPDGWDRKNYQYSWFKEKITLTEYNSRLNRSTVKGIIQKREPKQEIVGYRLKSHINRNIVDGILKNPMPIWNDADKSVYFIKGHVAGCLVAKMRELQILDLWFTPIYEFEEVKSDWLKQNHLDYYYKEGIMSNKPKQVTLEEVELAILFHNTYERLAPSFGYETRVDTKSLDITTPNGKLMIAVCKEIIKWQTERMYSEEEVKEIINLSCEEGMFIQRTINDKVRIPYLRIKDFTAKMFEQFKK